MFTWENRDISNCRTSCIVVYDITFLIGIFVTEIIYRKYMLKYFSAYFKLYVSDIISVQT